jgi:putative transposase
MEEYNKSSHAIYRCEYHFVWVPKYRYHVLVKEIKPRLCRVKRVTCRLKSDHGGSVVRPCSLREV